MRLWSGFIRFSGFGLLAAFTFGIFWACHLTQQEGQTYLDIDVDSSFTRFDELRVLVYDAATGAEDTVFNRHLSSVDELSKVPLKGYQGQQVTLTFTGFLDGQAVYQEVRRYDGRNPGNTSVEVTLSGAAVVSVRASTRSVTLQKGGPSREISAEAMPLIASQSFDWKSADAVVATVEPKSGDAARAMVTPVDTGRTLIVVASRTDASKTDTVTVTVVESGVESSNANLSALAVSTGALDNPAFSPQGRVSGASVANAVASISVTATVEDTTARLLINGSAAESGVPSASIPLNVGVDSIYIIVTAQDGTQRSYVVAMARAGVNARTNAKLASLTVSSGPLDKPAFNPANRVSGAAVANGVTSVKVTATVEDTTARVIVNGTPTASGTESGAIPLAVGLDSIYVIVTAQDASQKTYVIALARARGLSDNAKLAALTVSAGALNAPAFAPTSRVSGAAVANGVTSTTVTATVADTSARLTINGVPAASGAATAAIPLAVGVDSILVVVTAEDGTKNTYAIGITRSAPNASSNANLAALTLSAGALNAPAFSPASRVSGAAVANGVTSTTVTATVADTTARLTINGVAAVSGKASAPIPLRVGVDTIFVLVSAQDATQKTYAIGITRAKSSNASLSALTVSAGALNAPAFSPTGRVSGAAVANGVVSTTVTATLADTTARLTIKGSATASGVASAAIPLAVGVDSIFVVVTAQDATQKTYAIGITRAKSSNANLSALTLSAGTLNAPAFSPASRVSGVVVANSVSSTTVTATVADTTARLTIKGAAVASGAASAAIPVAVGVDSIFVVVTAQDGTLKTYAVGITRSASSVATLSALLVTPGLISPVFSAGVTAYTVNYTTESAVSVKATPTQAGATMTWNGAPLAAGVASAPIAVAYGSTTFNLVVTALDGIAKSTYVVTVVRVDNVPPAAPVVNAMPAKVYLSNPRWIWASGGSGGSGSYRYKFDNPDLTTGATLVTGASATPTIADGPHTIYVQERDAAGNWSQSGSASTFVMFGPASWYKFDNADYIDYGFNKNNGIATAGITLIASPGGKAKGAVHFDGIESLINLGVPKHPTTNDSITLSCWIMTDINSNGYAFWGQLSLSGVTNPDMVVGSVSNGTGRRISEFPTTGQTWAHVAVTYDGAGLVVYVNGNNQFGAANYTGSSALDGSSTIGAGNGRNWNGSIDDVRIYNRVLTKAEISALSSTVP